MEEMSRSVHGDDGPVVVNLAKLRDTHVQHVEKSQEARR
jgi:hypothetical protein